MIKKTVNRRTLMQAIGAAGLVSGLARPAIAQNKPVRLGWISDVTGVFASNAQAQDWAFRMAVEDINAAGGVDGHKLEIVMRDSAADTTKAVSYTKELLFNENVDVLCGPIQSGEALPTIGIAAGANKLQIVGGAVEQLIDPVKWPLAFRNLATMNQWFNVAIQITVQQMKRTKFAILNDNTGFGLLARDALVKLLADMNLKPVFTALVNPDKPDVTDEVVKAREAGADVITNWSTAVGFDARVANARGQLNWDVPIVGHQALLETTMAKLLDKPSYREKIYGIGYRSQVVDANGKLPANVEAFLDRHKDTAGRYLASAGVPAILQGHAAVYNYAAGLRKAGNPDPLKVKEALETVGEIDAPYGPFHYTPTDHNGLQADRALVLLEASRQLPSGAYPMSKF